MLSQTGCVITEGRAGHEGEWAHRPAPSGVSLELGLGQPPAERKPTPCRGPGFVGWSQGRPGSAYGWSESSEELDCRPVARPTLAGRLAGFYLDAETAAVSPNSDVRSRRRATVAHEHTATVGLVSQPSHSPGSDTMHLQQGPTRPQAAPCESHGPIPRL